MENITFVILVCLIIAIVYIIYLKYKYVMIKKNDPSLIPEELDFLKEGYEEQIKNMIN